MGVEFRDICAQVGEGASKHTDFLVGLEDVHASEFGSSSLFQVDFEELILLLDDNSALVKFGVRAQQRMVIVWNTGDNLH